MIFHKANGLKSIFGHQFSNLFRLLAPLLEMEAKQLKDNGGAIGVVATCTSAIRRKFASIVITVK